MHFLLYFYDEDGFQNISIDVIDFEYLCFLASYLFKTRDLCLFLFSDGTQINDNKYLETLEHGTKLFVCKTDEKENILIYFDLKILCSKQQDNIF